MYEKAIEQAQENGWFLAHQFETDANAEIHESTTAQETLGDFTGRRLAIFRSTLGDQSGERSRYPITPPGLWARK